MDLADPSHPSSNPLILEMSRSAGCEATGQRVLIRTMAGFDASRATGDKRKSKRIAQWLLSIMPQLACYGLAAPGLVPGYLGTGVLGAPIIVGPDGELIPLSISQSRPSRPAPWGYLGNLYLIFPGGRDVIMGRCRSWWGMRVPVSVCTLVPGSSAHPHPQPRPKAGRPHGKILPSRPIAHVDMADLPFVLPFIIFVHMYHPSGGCV